jgi:hypothetical protein
MTDMTDMTMAFSTFRSEKESATGLAEEIDIHPLIFLDIFSL